MRYEKVEEKHFRYRIPRDYNKTQNCMRYKFMIIQVSAGQGPRERQADAAWMEHYRIVRGNPVRTYEGERFLLKERKDGDAGQAAPSGSA